MSKPRPKASTKSKKQERLRQYFKFSIKGFKKHVPALNEVSNLQRYCILGELLKQDPECSSPLNEPIDPRTITLCHVLRARTDIAYTLVGHTSERSPQQPDASRLKVHACVLLCISPTIDRGSAHHVRQAVAAESSWSVPDTTRLARFNGDTPASLWWLHQNNKDPWRETNSKIHYWLLVGGLLIYKKYLTALTASRSS